MFIKKISIKNFRIFSAKEVFELDDLNVPDSKNEGSGVNLFVGENGCGKSSLLEAFSLPLLSYKAEGFSLKDFSDPFQKANICVYSKEDFEYNGTMPNAKYNGKGFAFEAGVRSRNTKSYLSSIVVNDQKYIRADGTNKPKDGQPDLRVNVNNPWSGARFNENDFLYLDENRTYQIRSGTYNPTRFDRLMEDFDYQYLKQKNNPIDCNEKLKEISNNIENEFFKRAVDKFKEVSGESISLSHINNWQPHNKSFLNVEKPNKQQIPLNALGSGYEMFFSLLYSFYLSQQNKKDLIILIDEPELHLHPKLQANLVKILLEFSKTAQIFLTTHSPLFVKQLMINEKVLVNCIKKKDDKINISKPENKVLPYISANEINYIAFGLATVEYHNELYGSVKEKAILEYEKNISEETFEKYLTDRMIPQDQTYIRLKKDGSTEKQTRTLPTKIRNMIHHPENKHNKIFTESELRKSIDLLIGLLT